MTSHPYLLPTLRRALPLMVGVLLMQACATTPPMAEDFGDNWKPVNVLADTPTEIPLKEEMAMHRFQLLPTDTSLRGLLERWAKEYGGTLDWQYPSDLTLVSALEQAADNNLQRALTVVRRTYSPQRLRVQVLANRDLRVTRLP
ncbi:hypothetical protein J2W49_000814 [Hydrogenophaga palleronii]|uniref:Toxin co-regulated pilus biosynthesis protein Q C-terminal domain-containing protein n=1 Tax=Hydrogenophaga palleronii TaxID=65655 RepID=A0ABU1WHZ5_9BURK|nr:hypothetical protein [Hydrogenophaga palleronii]MDR7148886.1 hypothetical protein [Hydrogenophaga palleronii]